MNMMKLGSATGSLVNHVMSQAEPITPVVGMGVTILGWTDRKAATITRVTRTQIHTVLDRAIRTDANGMSEAQEYRYEPNPQGRIDVFRMTKRGWRNASGNGLLIGVRREYYDYSF